MCEVTEGKKEAPYPEQGCRQLVLVEGMVCSREGQRRVEGDVLRSARQDRHEENQTGDAFGQSARDDLENRPCHHVFDSGLKLRLAFYQQRQVIFFSITVLYQVQVGH